MKRNLLVLSAVVLAIVFSSFTVKTTTDVFFVYNSGSNHSVRSNYTETTATQNPVIGSTNLKWIRITDDDGIVSGPEFSTMYDALDRTVPQNTTLNDDTEGTVTGVSPYVYKLEKGN
jgi:hypothetical protein